MPTPTLSPNQSDQDERFNSAEQDYQKRFAEIARDETEGNFDDIVKNYNQTADSTQEDANIKRTQDMESNPTPNSVPEGNWGVKNINAPQKGKLSFLKKKGPLMGIGGGFGVVGIVFGMITGSGSLLLPSISQNGFLQNDSRSNVLDRRLIKVIENKFKPASGACGVKPAACKLGELPNSMLDAMKKKGIEPLRSADANDSFDIGKDQYPKSGDPKPTHYSVPGENGERKIIKAEEFAAEFKANPVFRKAFKGAYNMRYLGYNGKFMLKNFFSKFKIKKDGGKASESSKLNESNMSDELDNALKGAGTEITEDGAKTTFKDFFRKNAERTAEKMKKSKGDFIIGAGMLACTAINAPHMVADVYRGVQAAQLAVLLSDIILSPGSMQQAGVAKAEKISAIGKMLTERQVNAGGSLGKSALDSKILQSAIGVNKNPIGVSSYAPGYSLVTNPVIKGSRSISSGTKSTCNLLASPQAMVAATAVEATFEVATAPTLIGPALIEGLKAVGKVLVVIGAVEGVMKLAEASGILDGIASASWSVIKQVIGDYTTGARFDKLGDVLGTAFYTFYPSAGLVGGLAPLKTSQVADFENVKAAVEEDTRQEDIATLSPFDTSSQYTFLGSIMYDYTLSGVVSDNPVQSALASLGYMLSSPVRLLSHNSYAQSAQAVQNCQYASEFGVDEDVAMNPGGFPCVGIPSEFMGMSTQDVFDLVDSDGEIDPETGDPTPSSDMSLLLADCADGSLESVSGCTINKASSESATGTFDERKRAAQSLYLIDHQIENMLNGTDTISDADMSSYLDSIASTDTDIYSSTDTDSDVAVNSITQAYASLLGTVTGTEFLAPVAQPVKDSYTIAYTPCERSTADTMNLLTGILPRMGIA